MRMSRDLGFMNDGAEPPLVEEDDAEVAALYSRCVERGEVLLGIRKRKEMLMQGGDSSGKIGSSGIGGASVGVGEGSNAGVFRRVRLDTTKLDTKFLNLK